jgi:hypothetical protein
VYCVAGLQQNGVGAACAALLSLLFAAKIIIVKIVKVLKTCRGYH